MLEPHEHVADNRLSLAAAAAADPYRYTQSVHLRASSTCRSAPTSASLPRQRRGVLSGVCIQRELQLARDLPGQVTFEGVAIINLTPKKQQLEARQQTTTNSYKTN